MITLATELLAKTALIVGLAVCIFLFGPTRTYIIILGVFVVLWAKEALGGTK